MLIEEKADRMHQQTAQQTIAQMPQITRPDPFHATAVRQLDKDGVDEIAHSAQHRTLVGCRLGRVGFAKGRLQENALGAQVRLQIGQPTVAIAQHHAGRALQQERHDFAIGFVGRSQEHAGDQARPTQVRMQPKAIKRLAVRMIFAEAGEAREAHAPGRTGKAADGQWLLNVN